MAKLWQRSKDPKTSKPVTEVNPSHLQINSPTIIFLPGIFTTDGKPAHIAEGLAEIENLLKHQPALKTKPKIFALTHKALCSAFNIASYNAKPQTACGREAKKAAKDIILPLVIKNGKPLPEAEARANLRNLTLAAYSAGTVFAQEIYNASLLHMTAAGYSEKSARDLLQEITLVSMATVSRPAEETARFTTLYLAAGNDIAVRAKNKVWRPVKELFAIDGRDLRIQEMSATSLFITAYIDKKMWHWREDDTGALTKADIPPLMPKRTGISSNHEMPHYTTSDDGHNAFSRLVLNGLVNAVNRDKKLSPLDLLAPVTAKSPEDAAQYRARIDKARLTPSAANDFEKKSGRKKKKDNSKKHKSGPPKRAA
jgi:hypothetical protein